MKSGRHAIRSCCIATRVAWVSLALSTLPGRGASGPGQVVDEVRIGQGSGGFGGQIIISEFGCDVSSLGDADGDGVTDLLVGAPVDFDDAVSKGAVWIVHLSPDGTAYDWTKISDGPGGISGTLADGDYFGWRAIPLGDLDGDHVTDLAVGAPGVDLGEENVGAVWILWMNDDGTVREDHRIDGDAYTGRLGYFGRALAPLGDFDGNGTPDVAVGSQATVWILKLGADGTVIGETPIVSSPSSHSFGAACDAIGDFDGDGTTDIAVGVPSHNGEHPGEGAVWIILLNPDGSAREWHLIAEGEGGLQQTFYQYDFFGTAVASVDDADGDGVTDLLVGAIGYDEFPMDDDYRYGAAWVLCLNADATVKSELLIGQDRGGFTGPLEVRSELGRGITPLGDLNGDGVVDLAVGAPGHDGHSGSVWVPFMVDTIEAPHGPSTPPVQPVVFPNPACGRLRITAPADRDGALARAFDVFDASGRHVVRLPRRGREIWWDGRDHHRRWVASATYFVRARWDDGRSSEASRIVWRSR